ncbi:MAG: hypothetical protein ACI92O_000329 [Colwellia sp.]
MIGNSTTLAWFNGLNTKLKTTLLINIFLTILFSTWDAILDIEEASTITEYVIGFVARGSQFVLVFFVVNYLRFLFSTDK